MKREHPNLTLVVLAYDEEDNVIPFLEEALAVLDGLPGDHEIIVVDDGSSDATLKRAKEFAKNDQRVRVVSHGQNLGMGAGMRTGFEAARGDYVSIIGADGQIPACSLEVLLPLLDRAPIVTSVYREKARPMHRRILSRGLRSMMRFLLGYSFMLEGIYLFPTDLARDVIGLDTIKSTTFFFSFELIGHAIDRGYRVETATIDVRPRVHGASKVANLRRISRVASELLKHRWRLRHRRSR